MPGGEAFAEGSSPLSPWAVWTITGPLLDASECAAWVARADGRLETGDFIFKTGKGGFERMATGLRRLSRCVRHMRSSGRSARLGRVRAGGPGVRVTGLLQTAAELRVSRAPCRQTQT